MNEIHRTQPDLSSIWWLWFFSLSLFLIFFSFSFIQQHQIHFYAPPRRSNDFWERERNFFSQISINVNVITGPYNYRRRLLAVCIGQGREKKKYLARTLQFNDRWPTNWSFGSSWFEMMFFFRAEICRNLGFLCAVLACLTACNRKSFNFRSPKNVYPKENRLKFQGIPITHIGYFGKHRRSLMWHRCQSNGKSQQLKQSLDHHSILHIK